MPDELHTPDHRWYQGRYHIPLAKEDHSKQWIFASGISKIDAWIDLLAGRDYSILGFEPEYVADFANERYRVQGASTPLLSDAITHSRASTATYVDSNGVLQTAGVNVPRVGHHVWNGSAWVNEGILHESEARTNLALYSEQFDNAAWAKMSITVTANDAVAPDGASTADRLVEDSSTGFHVATQSIFIAADTVHTVSMFVKAGSSSDRALRFSFQNAAGTDGVRLLFDPNTNTIVLSQAFGSASNLSASIQNAGNGWYRLFLTGKIDAVSTAGIIFATLQTDFTAFLGANYAGNGTSNILLWGAQLEVAPTPSSYIPTSGATVTRAADSMTIPAANLPWNPLAVSIQMDGRVTYADTGADEARFLNWNAGGGNYILHYLQTASTRTGQIRIAQNNNNVFDSAATSETYLSPDILVPFNLAGRHGSTFVNGAVDGTALTANTNPVALPDLSTTDLNLGLDYNGTIRTFRIWADDIGDTGIAEATS